MVGACLPRVSRPRGGPHPVPVRAHAAITMPGGAVWSPPVPLNTPLIITHPVVAPAHRCASKIKELYWRDLLTAVQNEAKAGQHRESS